MNNNALKLAFIGPGNMASAIVSGLVAQDFPAANIMVCGPEEDDLARMATRFAVRTSQDNQQAISFADVIVLSVKPQVMEDVCRNINVASSGTPPLFISIAAGLSVAQIAEWLQLDGPFVRCMPNTPAQVQLGASGLFANRATTPAQREAAEAIFSAVGTVAWVDKEEDLHAVTAVSGSGPAYCFLFLEGMIAAGTRLGLSEKDARALAIQTMRGAAELALRSDEPPASLKRRVMSPGGTTEQAIQHFEEAGLTRQIGDAMDAAWRRSYALAGEEPPQGG